MQEAGGFLALSMVVLLTAVYVKSPVHFSVFPSTLLLLTVFRLGLNIASTRRILLHGPEGTSAAGHVIQAFGQFVVGGNLVVGLVVFQGLLGMWTVTLLLKPAIVSAHLIGGLTTMALLWWMSLQTTRRSRSKSEDSLRRWAVIGTVVLVVQILLGGWVSTNYAAVACPDFPTCQRSFWPTMDFKDAFVLWRGLGIDYEGGVLDHPARVAIHFTHRIGAIVAALVLGFVAWKAMRTSQSSGVRTAGTALAATLVTQLMVGPLMVIKTFPLPLATAHNAMAALLVLSMVALLRFLFPPRGSGIY